MFLRWFMCSFPIRFCFSFRESRSGSRKIICNNLALGIGPANLFFSSDKSTFCPNDDLITQPKIRFTLKFIAPVDVPEKYYFWSRKWHMVLSLTIFGQYDIGDYCIGSILPEESYLVIGIFQSNILVSLIFVDVYRTSLW